MEKQWWKEEIIYQIYPKSFYDSNNDGIGDLAGITQKLDYLHELGITMLWICPIFKSPMVDNGYDISDYQAIEAEFGTMADFDELVIKAKEKNIKIMLDLVVNHTSDEHEWFQSAINTPNSKYRDYYIFKEGIDGKAPNNWRSIFGGSVWELVPGTPNTYYFHTFDKKQPDLNWENESVRQEIYKMVNWWLDKGINGFRIDSITFVKKDQDYANAPIDGSDGLASVKHKGRNRPGIEKFLHELNRETFQKYQCVTIGEAPGVQYDEFSDYIGEKGYFNMIFDFKYADIDVENGSEWFRRTKWTTQELKEKIFKSQQAFENTGWGATFLENHDQPRSLSKYITNHAYQNHIGAKALAGLFLALKGTPCIYQGQEIGMLNFERNDISQFDDVSSIDNFHRAQLEGYSEKEALYFVNQRSRDNGRTPFHWNHKKNNGFSQKDPWLAMANCTGISVQQQKEQQDSVLDFYKHLLKLRKNKTYANDFIYGKFEPIETSEHIIAFERGDKIVSITNLSSQEQFIDLKIEEVLATNYVNLKKESGTILLQPYQTILAIKGV